MNTIIGSRSICRILALLCCVFSGFATAAPQGEEVFGDTRLLYSVFNSTFLSPEIAQQYNIKRSANEVVINITLLDKNTGKPVAAKVEGAAKNLMQQVKPLKFREIREQDAVYYLAVMRTTEREVFHFAIKVTPPTGAPFEAKFTQELFVNP